MSIKNINAKKVEKNCTHSENITKITLGGWWMMEHDIPSKKMLIDKCQWGNSR